MIFFDISSDFIVVNALNKFSIYDQGPAGPPGPQGEIGLTGKNQSIHYSVIKTVDTKSISMNHFVGPKGVAGDVGRPGQTGSQGLPGDFYNPT